MPEIGTLTSVAPLTYVLALVTGADGRRRAAPDAPPHRPLRRAARRRMSYPRNALSALRMTATSTTSWKSAPATGWR